MCLFPPPGPGKPIASRRSPTCRRARLVYILYYVHLCVVVSYHYRVVPLHTTTKGRLITLLFIYYFRCRRVSLHRVPPPFAKPGWVVWVRASVFPPPPPPPSMCNTDARARALAHARTYAFVRNFYPPPPAAIRCARYLIQNITIYY